MIVHGSEDLWALDGCLQHDEAPFWALRVSDVEESYRPLNETKIKSFKNENVLMSSPVFPLT